MPLEQLVPMIKFWLVKNISHKPQVIRSKDLKNGMLVMNPGSQEWVNCAVHQQVMDCEWCKTITNDVDYENSIGSGEIDAALPVKEEYVSLRIKDRHEGILPGAEKAAQELPSVYKRVGLADTDIQNPDAEDYATCANLPQEKQSGCPQCIGIKGDGTQCGRNADVGSDYCYIHKPKV